MSTRFTALAAAIGLFVAASAPFGCATDGDPDGPDEAVDRSAEDFAEDECPNCIPAGTAPIEEEESE